jgi:methylglutamate dehydrogenase subunit D
VPDLVHQSGFAGLHTAGSGDGVAAQELIGLSIATVLMRRGQLGALSAAVAAAYAVALPEGPRWTGHDGLVMLGTGPGRWLFVSMAHEATLVENLTRQFDGLASVVEQSDGLAVLRLTGLALLETLAKGVAIDLAPEAFPTGSVAVTSIAHIGATLWKVDDAPTFDIAVARSFAKSFLHWLESSAAAYGLSVLR